MDMEFSEWMDAVDDAIGEVVPGLGHECLPDIPYWDMWASECSPAEAAYTALEEADAPAELLELVADEIG